MVGGRIQAVANEANVESEKSSELGTGFREKLAVSSDESQAASIHYELSAGAERLSVEVIGGRRITIRRGHAKTSRAADDSQPFEVEFHQPLDGPLTLNVTDRHGVRMVRGPTLWHLLLYEPELCRAQLLPLLQMFRPDWHLPDTADAIEAEMLRNAAAYRPENLKRWAALVADLASDKFSVRRHADRRLRAAGMTVIPYLQSLDRRRLDFEQLSRIDEIVAATETDDEDQAGEVAAHFMPDREIWLVFLDRPLESTRQTAARQLSYWLGAPIAFDPAASEPVRSRQLAALRQRIAHALPAAGESTD